MEETKKDPLTYQIIGAAMEVHKELGCGFLEAVYQEAFAKELKQRRIKYSREVELPIFYKGERLTTFYMADFICFNSVVVELKALQILSGIEQAQIINYLKVLDYRNGLLLNFGKQSLEYKRFANQAI
jgi:GxxExxY protein